jgi:hypothetical protein
MRRAHVALVLLSAAPLLPDETTYRFILYGNRTDLR